MRKVLTVLTVGGLILSSPSSAQDEQVQTLIPASQWNVVYDDWVCRLNRTYKVNNKEALFSFTREPLAAKNWLIVGISDEKGKRDGDDAIMSMDGKVVAEDVHYNIFDATEHRVRQFRIDLEEIPLQAANQMLRFDLKRHGTIEIPVPDFPAAWDALNACMDDLYAEFGVSNSQQAAIATGPEGRIYDAFDIPKNVTQINFAFFYWINESGRVDDCKLVLPSGHENFDTTFCREIKSRARFQPAKDESGNPIRVAQFENLKLYKTVTTIPAPR